MSVVLNGSEGVVRSIALQFKFPNGDIVPQGLRQLPHETQEGYQARKDRAKGIVAITQTECCSVYAILEELLGAGYELANAFYQSRREQGSPQGTWPWVFRHVVQFGLAHNKFVKADLSVSIEGKQQAFIETCIDSMWRVQAFCHPFCENGEEVPGQWNVIFVFDKRVPLYGADGEPVMVWPKDEDGRKSGRRKDEDGKWIGTKVPLKPSFDLRVVGGVVQPVPVP